MAISMFVGWEPKQDVAGDPAIDSGRIIQELQNKIKGLKMQNGRLKAQIKRLQEARHE